MERGLLFGQPHAQVPSLSLKFNSIMMLSFLVLVLQSVQIFHDTRSIFNIDAELLWNLIIYNSNKMVLDLAIKLVNNLVIIIY